MIKDLRDALRELPTPEAEPGLRAKILSARASGKRVRLPRGGTTVRIRFVVAAAIVALVAIADWTRVGPGRAQEGGRQSYPGLLVGAPLWPTVMAAQEVGNAPSRPKYAPIVDFDPSRVRGGTWTYEGRTTTDAIYTSSYGRLAINALATKLDGTAVWLVTTQRSPTPNTAESLFVSQATLLPVRYTLNSRGSSIYIEQRYSTDSVHETIDVTGHNKRHLRGAAALPAPGEVVVLMGPFAADLNLLAQALPLERGWRGSAYALGLVSPSRGLPPLTPVDFRVVGRDRVTVPAGLFDCWKVEIIQREASGDFRSLVWLSRDQQWVVKIENRGGDFVTEQVLTSYQSPNPPPP